MWYNQHTVSNGATSVDAITGILGVMTEYSGYDDIAWCDIIKSGCDVICSSYDIIHFVDVLSYNNEGYMIYYLDVMTEIQWMCFQI